MNKKAFVQLAIPIILGLVVVGLVTYMLFMPKAQAITPEEKQQVNDNTNHLIAPSQPESCPSGQARNNNGNCEWLQCPQGQVRQNDGSCIIQEFSPTMPDVQPACVPSGFFKSAYVRTKGNVGEIAQNPLGSYPAVVTYQFQVTSNCKARYYFEAGLSQPALTLLQPAGSKCDGSNHYAGQFITMDSNTIVNQGGKAGVVDIAFFPLDYGKAQTLTAKGGVYTGCMKDGGKVIVEIPEKAITYKLNGYSANDITNSWVKVI